MPYFALRFIFLSFSLTKISFIYIFSFSQLLEILKILAFIFSIPNRMRKLYQNNVFDTFCANSINIYAIFQSYISYLSKLKEKKVLAKVLEKYH